MRSFRITGSRFGGSAFSGEGARLYGGRWNSRGVPMVYTSGSLSLATLEILVHLRNPDLLSGYLWFPVEFDDSRLAVLEPGRLPGNWREYPGPESLKALGDEWIRAASSPVLAVPSVIIPEERNYLINPFHPAFGELLIGDARPFGFDPRLTG